MGRPPIGKTAMSATERSRRYRAGLATKPDAAKPDAAKPDATKHAAKPDATKHATKPDATSTADAELAAAKARIRELEATLAKAHRVAAVPADGKMSAQTFKLLCSLDAPEDGVVLNAARALVRNLKASGSDLRTLSDALEAEWKKTQQPKERPVTVDYTVVDGAIDRSIAGREKVTFDRVWKAIVAAVPVLDKGGPPARHAIEYTHRRLQRLGFTASNSMRSFQRGTPR